MLLHKTFLGLLPILSAVVGCCYNGVKYQMGLFRGRGFMHLLTWLVL